MLGLHRSRALPFTRRLDFGARLLLGNANFSEASAPQVTADNPAILHEPFVRRLFLDVNEMDPKTFLVVGVKTDDFSILNRVLNHLHKNDLTVSHLESTFSSFVWDGPSFHIDVEADMYSDKLQRVVREMRSVNGVRNVSIAEDREVPWFPVNIRDLDLTTETLDGGTALINDDHPGFHDEIYRERRGSIIESAKTYQHGSYVDTINYTDLEVKTWGACYKKLRKQHELYACKEHLRMMPLMEEYCNFSETNVPQLEDISDFLQQQTGFRLRPVAGLLSARDFLNALAFRVFFSTQYLRHHGNPFYTPEPDIVHELMGHVPMFACSEFAQFSQDIGLASLAASDNDILRLATLYWFTVEFGLLRDESAENGVKAMGAGVLSSIGELEWSCTKEPSVECRKSGSVEHLERPEILPFDASVVANTQFPITTFQPKFFAGDSLDHVKMEVEKFCETLTRPFFPRYDPLTETIKVTRAITRAKRVSLVEQQTDKLREWDEQYGAESSQ